MVASERSSQFSKALLELRALILGGEFDPKVRLPEIALSDRLGISRTPLRQAMDRLVEEGLLERIGTGGCRVASFSISDIEDAIEIRGVLEGTAARLAAERGAEPQALARIEEVLNGLDRAVILRAEIDFDAYVRLNAEFHRQLVRLSGSQIVAREAERAGRLPLASPSAFMQGQEFIPDFQASLRRAQEQHRTIVEAIKARQGSRAEALAREHARLAGANLKFVMNADPRLAQRVPGLALVSEG